MLGASPFRRARHATWSLALLCCASVGVLDCSPGRAALRWSGPVRVHEDGAHLWLAASCASAALCVGVDRFGQAVRFDPTDPSDWAAHTVDFAADGLDSHAQYPAFTGIACPTARQCTATDGLGQEVTFDPFSSSVPTAVRLGSPLSGFRGGLGGISCPTSTQCTTTDGGAEITFDPRAPARRRRVTLVSRGELGGVVCPSSSLCLTASAGAAILRFDPDVRKPLLFPTVNLAPFEIGALACSSASQCTASLGSAGGQAPPEAITFDPNTGAVTSRISTNTQRPASEIACPSASECSTVDLDGKIVGFDPMGSTSEAVGQLPAYMGLLESSLACASATECLVFDATLGTIHVYNPAMPEFVRTFTLDGGSAIAGVVCSSSALCVAAVVPVVGIPGFQDLNGTTSVLHLVSGQAGKPSPLPLRPTAVACQSARRCIAVGRYVANASAVSFKPSSRGKAALLQLGGVEPAAVACPTDRDCAAVDASGYVVTFNPATATMSRLRRHRLDTSSLTAIGCPAANQCTAVDLAGNEITFDPRATGRSHRRRLEGVGLTALACPRTSECVALDKAGRELTFDPDANTHARRHRIAATAQVAIACPSSTLCLAVDHLGDVHEGNPEGAGAWTSRHLNGAGPLTAVACPAAERCVAVDRDGNAYIARRARR